MPESNKDLQRIEAMWPGSAENKKLCQMLGDQAETRFELRRAYERRRAPAGRGRRAGIDREACTPSASPSPSTYDHRPWLVRADDEDSPLWMRVLFYIAAALIGGAIWLGVLIVVGWIVDRIYS